jgi:EAL domain-containing protein (putative c-di-GMP-specific phosphodiesterase class I)
MPEIDDFGTCFSSLSPLNSFPFDVVKIDHCFVSRMGSDDKTYRMAAGSLISFMTSLIMTSLIKWWPKE